MNKELKLYFRLYEDKNLMLNPLQVKMMHMLHILDESQRMCS